MIAFLRGRMLEKHPNRVDRRRRGVGYDVPVPLSTFYGVGEPGADDRAAHPHARARGRARALRLRARALELELFERLIAVSGIGPKLALAVLSGIEPRELVQRRSQRGDLARLTAIPGVGKKTAERIVLELKDRLPQRAVAQAVERRSPRRRRAARRSRLGAREPRLSSAARSRRRVDAALHEDASAAFEVALRADA